MLTKSGAGKNNKTNTEDRKKNLFKGSPEAKKFTA